MSEELKPCPFCGGKAEKITEGINYIIVGCRSLACGARPITTCYESIDGFNLWPWNKRA